MPHIALIMLLSMMEASVHAANLSGDFRGLLTGTNYIRYIKVGLPGDMFEINGKKGSGIVYYEASLQENTFWLKNCTNSIPGSGPIFPGCTIGASGSENWYVRSEGYVAKSPKPKNGLPVESVDSLAANSLTMLRCAFGLGIALKAGSFAINDDNTFKAETIDGDHLAGAFSVSEAGGRATSCKFSISSIPDATVQVNYDYSARNGDSNTPANIPAKMQMTVSKSGEKMMEHELQILSCEFGRLDIPHGEFTPEIVNPSAVLTYKKAFDSEVIFSNSAVYQRMPDGTLHVVKASNFLKSNGFVGWRFFVCVTIPVITALLFWVLVRSRRA